MSGKTKVTITTIMMMSTKNYDASNNIYNIYVHMLVKNGTSGIVNVHGL